MKRHVAFCAVILIMIMLLGMVACNSSYPKYNNGDDFRSSSPASKSEESNSPFSITPESDPGSTTEHENTGATTAQVTYSDSWNTTNKRNQTSTKNTSDSTSQTKSTTSSSNHTVITQPIQTTTTSTTQTQTTGGANTTATQTKWYEDPGWGELG